MDYEYNPIDNCKNNIYNVTEDNQIVLCCYKIIGDDSPFLQYLLADNKGVLDFPRFSVSFKPFAVRKYSESAQTVNKDRNELSIKNIFKIARTFLLDITKIENHINCYRGHKKYKNDIYLFFDISCCKLKVCDATFCLVDELVNTKHVCGTKIDDDVTNFAINNISMFSLVDKQKRACEIPSVVYVGTDEPNLAPTYTFGVNKSLDNMSLGPYYYFTDFENASKHYGVVRFALFNGHMLVKQNCPDDDLDESLVKKQRLNDPPLDRSYEAMTLRITDHAGKWATSYDSVYLGRLELDDGRMLDNAPFIVAKSHDQQTPLSYHILSK